MDIAEKINATFRDEQTRRAVRSMLGDERHRNVALAWIGLKPDYTPTESPYQDMIKREFRDKLAKN